MKKSDLIRFVEKRSLENRQEVGCVRNIIFKVFRAMLLILLICTAGTPGNARNNPGNQSLKETGETRGFDLVIVADVSPAKNEKQYYSLLEEAVSAIYNRFKNSFQIKATNNFYLITLQKSAKLLKTKILSSEALIKAIKQQVKARRTSINLKDGIYKVFELVEKQFPQKPGIVLFISNGNNGKINLKNARNDYKPAIHALKKIGYTTFSLYLDAGKLKCRDCMVMISEWAQTQVYVMDKKEMVSIAINQLMNSAINLPFQSPVERNTFTQNQKKWKTANKELTAKIDKLKKLSPKNNNNKNNSQAEPDYELRTLLEKQKSTTGKLWFFIALLIIIILYLLRKIFGFHHSNLNLLWGKLIFIKGNKKGSLPQQNVIDLSTRLKGTEISSPGSTPQFYLTACSHLNKKVICAHTNGKGNLKYHKLENDCPVETSKYLGKSSKHVNVSNKYGNHFCEYQYEFLGILERSCRQPTPKELFFGRDKLVNEIAENFLNKRKKNRYDIIISGMGSSGKTSLLNYLLHFLPDEPRVKGFSKDKFETFATDLIKYNSQETVKLTAFKEKLKEKIDSLRKNPAQRKILLLDNYDDLLCDADLETRNLIKDCHTGINSRIYLVLAGKIPADLIREEYSEYLPEHFKEKVLEGIKNPIQLIDAVLIEIGFPQQYIKREAKTEIARYASALPYFCKKLLLEIMKIWLDGSKTKTITLKLVRQAAVKVAASERKIYLEKIIPYYDKGDHNKRDTKRFQNIINEISKVDGSIPVKELEWRLTNDEDDDIRQKQIDSFYQKLGHLIKLGLIIDQKGVLKGIPYLFHFQGG